MINFLTSFFIELNYLTKLKVSFKFYSYKSIYLIYFNKPSKNLIIILFE